jgi:hypothetical protein
MMGAKAGDSKDLAEQQRPAATDINPFVADFLLGVCMGNFHT